MRLGATSRRTLPERMGSLSVHDLPVKNEAMSRILRRSISSQGMKRRMALLWLALGGTLAGHALGYSSASHVHPQSAAPDGVHGYLSGVAGFVVPLAVVAFGWFVVVGSRNRRKSPPGLGYFHLLLLQAGIYASQEILERLVAGRELSGVLAEPAVLGGLAAQVLVASTVLSALHLLRSAVASASTPFASQKMRVGSRGEPRSLVSRVIPRVRRQAGSCSLRGPPVPAIA